MKPGLRHRIANTVRVALDSRTVLLRWAMGDAKNNFGDKLNPYLVEKLSNRKVFNTRETWNVLRKPQYSVIGSSLGRPLDREFTIWGTGFLSHNRAVYAPKKICAVRGPLSRRKLLDAGIDCPEVYGDPALLLPRYVSADSSKKCGAVLVPHFRDAGLNVVREVDTESDATILSITAPIEEFVRGVVSSECVITSSLHALIVADAYQVPSLWVRLSDNPKGDWFKYQDYYESIGYTNMTPATFESARDIQRLARLCRTHELDIDLEKLVRACPFSG